MMHDCGKTSNSDGDSLISNNKESEERVYYPTLYLSDIKGLRLPQSGTATIKFRLDRVVVSKGGDDDDAKRTYDVEILAIGDIKADSQNKKSREEELDELAAEVSKESGEGEEEED
jgi:hypothetical protein